jgi:hypothetical protein
MPGSCNYGHIVVLALTSSMMGSLTKALAGSAATRALAAYRAEPSLRREQAVSVTVTGPRRAHEMYSRNRR